MPDLEVLSLAIESVTLLFAAAALGVVIAALRTVRQGFMAMTANAAQRAAEFDERHAETMAALALRRQALDSRSRALESLIERTAPTAD